MHVWEQGHMLGGYTWKHKCSEVSLIIWWNSSWPLIPWLLVSSISCWCCCGNGVQGQHVFLDLYWKSRCQHSICSAESWVGEGERGLQYVTVLALIRSGPSSGIIPHKQQDKTINIVCSQMLLRSKLLEDVKLWSVYIAPTLFYYLFSVAEKLDRKGRDKLLTFQFHYEVFVN